MSNDEWPREFQDRSALFWWWWREKDHPYDWFKKTWAEKGPRDRDRSLGAFRFELARRSNGKPSGKPYPNAHPPHRDLLEPFSNPFPIIIRKDTDTGTQNRYIKLSPLSFCSLSSRGKILQELGKIIDMECKANSVTLRTDPSGIRNRPPSWQWIELLDRKYILLEKKFSDENRSKISSASHAAKKLHKLLSQAISEQDLYEG